MGGCRVDVPSFFLPACRYVLGCFCHFLVCVCVCVRVSVWLAVRQVCVFSPARALRDGGSWKFICCIERERESLFLLFFFVFV
jgi:hypothetical protein